MDLSRTMIVIGKLPTFIAVLIFNVTPYHSSVVIIVVQRDDIVSNKYVTPEQYYVNDAKLFINRTIHNYSKYAESILYILFIFNIKKSSPPTMAGMRVQRRE